MSEPYSRTHPEFLDEHVAVDEDMARIWRRHAPAAWIPRECVVTYYHQGPFTVCLLRHDGRETLESIVGVTKQCRYADRADEYDPQRGERIALSRALQNAKRITAGLMWLADISKEVPA